MSQYERILLWIIRIGIVALLFTPLIVSKSLFFPFITGKNFYFRIIVELVFGVWLALAIISPSYRPRRSALLIALLSFIGILTIAAVFGADPYHSFWSNFERMEGLITHLHLFAYFLVAAHMFSRKEWFVFWNLFLIAGLGQNIVALLQKLGVLTSPQGGFRSDGTIGNATYVAAYSLFVFAASLMLFLRSKVRAWRYWYGFMALFTLLTIYFTATRGAILALFVGFLLSGILFLFLARSNAPHIKKYKKWTLIALAVLIILGGSLKIFEESVLIKKSNVLSRLASISLVA